MRAATSTVILGAGFGGIVAANTLRSLVPKSHRITMVDSSAAFTFGLEKTWVAIGEATSRSAVHSLVPLEARGIDVLRATVTSIDARARKVITTRGELLADYLVIALGADTNMAAIPGLERAAHTFYTLEGAIAMRDAMERFAGGDVVLLIPRSPFKCPPGPYEGMFLIHDYFKRRGLADKCKFRVYTVEGSPMATAGPDIGKFVVEELGARGIEFHPQRKAVSVDHVQKTIRFEEGPSARFDLLIAIPPHEAPKVVKDAGLTNASGWIPADPKNLAVSGYQNVYAIGDVAVVQLPGRFKPESPLVLPKAGIFAAAHGRVAARHIAAKILGKKSGEEFDGKGFCYIEMGDMHAVKGEGFFFNLPHPVMARRVPDMTQYQEKKAWVEGWLRENLS